MILLEKTCCLDLRTCRVWGLVCTSLTHLQTHQNSLYWITWLPWASQMRHFKMTVWLSSFPSLPLPQEVLPLARFSKASVSGNPQGLCDVSLTCRLDGVLTPRPCIFQASLWQCGQGVGGSPCALWDLLTGSQVRAHREESRWGKSHLTIFSVVQN